MPLPPKALFVSLGLHLLVGFGVVKSARSVVPDEYVQKDVWSGDAVEIESVSAAVAADTGERGHEGEAEPAVEPAPPLPVEAITPKAAPLPLDATEKLAAVEPRPPTVAPRARPSVAAPPGEQGSPEANASATAASTGTAVGSVGLPAGVRHLPSAFTRALPQASWADPGWLTLDFGPAGEITVELVVDDEGKLSELVFVDPKAAQRQPAPLRHMAERALLLLKSGTFSIAPSVRESGRQRFKLVLEISQSKGAEDEHALPHHLHHEEYSAPRGGSPGKAVFTLNSGRRVEARVFVLE